MSEDTYFSDIPEHEVHEALKPPAPWDAAVYDATINEAIEYQGEGKDFACVKLTCTIVNSEGKSKKLPLWVLSKNPNAKQMGVQFLRNIGLVENFKVLYRGNPQELVGRSGRVAVEVKGGSDGVNRNQIKGFVKPR